MKELMYCMESAGIFAFACFRELTVSLTTKTLQEIKLTAVGDSQTYWRKKDRNKYPFQ